MKDKSNIKALLKAMLNHNGGTLNAPTWNKEYLEKISDAYRDIEEDDIADNILKILKEEIVAYDILLAPFPGEIEFRLHIWTFPEKPEKYCGECLNLFEIWVAIRSR